MEEYDLLIEAYEDAYFNLFLKTHSTKKTLFHGKLERQAGVVRLNFFLRQRGKQMKEDVPWVLNTPFLQKVCLVVAFHQVEEVVLGVLFTKYSMTYGCLSTQFKVKKISESSCEEEIRS
ncbi:hypothetical protein ACTXT7_013745 [Hymenolepis weldensis]